MNMSKENNADLLDSFDPGKLAVEYLTPHGRRGYRKPALEGDFVDEKIAYGDGYLALRRWLRVSNERTVLLVHGWAGSQSDMHGLIPAVLEAGFNAVTVDLPAHGDSTGDTATLDQLADALVHVAGELRPLHIFASELLPRIDIPGLIIHSDDDEVIGLETGKQIAVCWKHSRFIEMHGLGHRKILRDSQVINAVIDFICEKSTNQNLSQLETSGIRNHV
jgi:pimeloyl-ACP methyl ester carboxylesterase